MGQHGMHVTVNLISGTRLELDVEQDCTAAALKSRVAQICNTPPVLQKLLMGTEELQDSDKVADQHTVQNLTLLVCMHGLTDRSELKRKLVVRGIGEYGSDHDIASTELVSAVVARLDDADFCVRVAAKKALSRIAEGGRERAIESVFACIRDAGDGEWNVLLQKALPLVAGVGETRAINVVLALFNDPRKHVQKAAVNAIDRLSVKGDPKVVDAMLRLFNDPQEDVRAAALGAIGGVADKDDEKVINSVLAFFQDPCGEVRKAAVHAIHGVSKAGGINTFKALLALFRDPVRKVRKTALEMIPDMIEKGDANATNEVLALCRDPQVHVRKAALWTIPYVAQSGNEQVMQEIRGLRSDPDEEVRALANFVEMACTSERGFMIFMMEQHLLDIRAMPEELEMNAEALLRG